MKTAERFEYFLAFLASTDMGRISCFTKEVNDTNNQTEQVGLVLYLRVWVTTKIITNENKNKTKKGENVCDRLFSLLSLLDKLQERVMLLSCPNACLHGQNYLGKSINK